MNVTRVAARIASGTVGGLAWACALRAYLSEISGYSTFTWAGTFLGILLPGVLAGGAIGAATVLDSSGSRQRIALRCCAGAVLGFAVFPQLVPGMFAELVTTGLGGGPSEWLSRGLPVGMRSEDDAPGSV